MINASKKESILILIELKVIIKHLKWRIFQQKNFWIEEFTLILIQLKLIVILLTWRQFQQKSISIKGICINPDQTKSNNYTFKVKTLSTKAVIYINSNSTKL